MGVSVPNFTFQERFKQYKFVNSAASQISETDSLVTSDKISCYFSGDSLCHRRNSYSLAL